MITPSGRVAIDTSFLERLSYLPEHIEQAAKVATWRTNNWLRNYSMNLLGVELKISNSGASRKVDPKSKAVLYRRFKPYKKAMLKSGKHRIYSSKLWVGLNALPLHRLGKPKQLSGSRVQDATGEIHNNAFIHSGNGWNQPMVVQRNVDASTAKERKKYVVVTKDMADEMESVMAELEPEINGMYQEFFYAELRKLTPLL